MATLNATESNEWVSKMNYASNADKSAIALWPNWRSHCLCRRKSRLYLYKMKMPWSSQMQKSMRHRSPSKATDSANIRLSSAPKDWQPLEVDCSRAKEVVQRFRHRW